MTQLRSLLIGISLCALSATLAQAAAPGQQLFIKTLEGRTHTVDIAPTSTIGDVKLQLSARTGQPVAHIKLVWGGKALDNAMSVDWLQQEEGPHMIIRAPAAAAPVLPAPATPAIAALPAAAAFLAPAFPPAVVVPAAPGGPR